MDYAVNSIDEYMDALPEDRRAVIEKLRILIKDNLPEGFEEQFSYGMIGYVVPFSRYPAGYHAQKGEPLPFLALASQKNFIALYHMGMYFDPAVVSWFQEEYAKQVPTKLDMGKSCIRLKNPKHIPYNLIGELCQKISVDEYIAAYEQALQK